MFLAEYLLVNDLNSDVSLVDDIVARMLLYKDKENAVSTRVTTEKLSRLTTPFQILTSNEFMDFPELSERELMILFTGSYQYLQAASYLAEILNPEGTSLNVEFLKEDSSPTAFVRFWVQFRYINCR